MAMVVLISSALLIASFLRGNASSTVFCNGGPRLPADAANVMELQLEAILHYATSKVIPQQTIDEIRLSYDVLRSLSPCNFLVFRLGHDSLMWASFNPRGTTLFLEEDPKWVQTVLKNAPGLRANTINYRTKLSDANDLLSHYRNEPDCSPTKSFINGNSRCKLALNMLQDEVYDKEWDIIMIDAPRGYFPEAPGRMAAIYSAAVMARNRKSPGVTHVYLHDVERQVEKVYAKTFLYSSGQSSIVCRTLFVAIRALVFRVLIAVYFIWYV
ncbi:probable methyltransferase At1g27930 [Olea europaea subsp. europaea]|uniref:Probable methyltransferase At1g27930 n=1 Tax=Olea europaea subsp. europaea TaxID=158383 RepID=A0A8S0SHB3_OLEEU|nr:probable methyltransferase At1g27930 [Olea europaea subsp. europaea]